MNDHTHDEKPPHALTAFIVVVPEDGGTPYATTDIDPHTTLTRNPTPADVRRACRDIVDDFNAKAAAEYVLMLQKENKPDTPADRVKRARQQRRSTEEK